MFRRRWSGLPEDPIFPSDLQQLGYFINSDDEIRNIQDPNFYFKFFATRNERYNDRRRFALNEAVRKIVHERLAHEGLRTRYVPRDVSDEAENRDGDDGDEKEQKIVQPRVPILVSKGYESAKRVVLVFGESEQDLGVIAHRVLSGRGGVDKGSMVSVVRALRAVHNPDSLDRESEKVVNSEDGRVIMAEPGIILANCGERYWWPEGQRTVTPRDRYALPIKSAAMLGRWDEGPQGMVKGSETVLAHVESVMNEYAVPLMEAHSGVVFDIIAVGDAAEAVVTSLDRDWDRVGKNMGCLALLGAFFDGSELRSDGLQAFLRDRTRAYTNSHELKCMPIAGPDGNGETNIFTRHGCPLFSAGPGDFLTETLLTHAHPMVMEWMSQVLKEGSGYKNPHFEVAYGNVQDQEVTWGDEVPAGETALPAAAGDVAASIDPDTHGGLKIMTREEFEALQK